MERKSSNHMRALSRLGVDLQVQEQNVSDLSISKIAGMDDAQDVTGLAGRLRLQKQPSTQTPSRNWMDKQRKHLQAYEYLCHIAEAKQWLEGCIDQPLGAVVDLEERLRDGVALAQLAKRYKPALVPRIFEAPKLQFRHSDNINRFFRFVEAVHLPATFQFELTDLYEKKNVPKVIYCIHALSFVLARSGQAAHIGDLVGKLDFSEAEIRQTQQSLAATGLALPNFKGVSEAFAVLEPTGPAEETIEKKEEAVSRYTTQIASLQGLASGSLLRMRIAGLLAQLEGVESSVLALQCQSKGFLVRISYYKNADTYHRINAWIIALQSTIRGHLVRSRTATQMIGMSFNETFVTHIQASLRGLQMRRALRDKRFPNQAVTMPLIELQSRAKGLLVRKHLRTRHTTIAGAESDIRRLQAQCRGRLYRNRCVGQAKDLNASTERNVRLQSACRGHLIRRAYQQKLSSTASARLSILNLQALCRGRLMRKMKQSFRALVQLELASIDALQAAARASLTRIRCRHLLLSLDEHHDNIVDLQASCLGVRHRRKFLRRQKHYIDNMRKVIMVQSIFRAKQQGAAYKSLIEDKDPPISTIKSFVHLLDDNAVDFEEEVATEQARRQIVLLVRQNEAAEEHIEQMDIKIALLVKQAIKIDEVIQHQKRLLRGVGSDELISNPLDLRAINKTARDQLENYQRFFYVLQTQPVYLVRLYAALGDSKKPEEDLQRLDALVSAIFGHAQQRREEYYLTKLIRACIIKQVSASSSVAQFVTDNFSWSNLYAAYVKSPKYLRFLKVVLGPVVLRIIEDASLDLESDPCLIYKAIKQISAPGVFMEASAAISDPETRQVYVRHLRDLRDLVEQLVQNAESSVQSAPFGIRFLTSEGLRAMRERLPTESTSALLPLFGRLFYSMFLAPALMKPDIFGIHDGLINARQRRNLAELAKLSKHVFLGQCFDDDSFLAPLNHFIDSYSQRIEHLCDSYAAIGPSEDHFGFSEFEDILATKRPGLYIRAADIYAMQDMIVVNKQSIVPEAEDVLGQILQNLGPVKANNEEMSMMGLSENEIYLQLDPNAVDVDDPEADERVLFMHTKRLALYIIRIQSRSTFLEVLVEAVNDHDEERWQEIILEEQHTRRALQSATARSRKDLSASSFADIKREALENILKLEDLGWLSRSNGYQDLVNSIAQDIKTQNRRRIERRMELNTARATLHELTIKRQYLESQHQSYNDYIEQAMLSLQGKKSKRKSVLPFTKQFFHLRDLQRAGSVPKFGSRKYSAFKLYTKGVLLSIRHESAPYDKFELVISSDQIGLFTLDIFSSGAVFARFNVQLDELLQAQYNKQEFVDYNNGQFKFTVNALLNMLFKHFFN